MGRSLAILAAALAFLFIRCAGLAAEPIQNVEQLAERLEQLRHDVKIPAFSAAIASGDRIVWAQGFGLADVEAQTPATPETCYHLASLTKTFASTIILQLVEEGKLDLDAPISQYGVELPSESTIRVVHLLNHTSGGVPGERYSYDGNRFALLTQIVEKVTGKSFGELVCERIIKKLGLEQTAPNIQDPESFALTGLDRDAFAARLATPYELGEDGAFRRIENREHFNCSAGLISNVLDVARYSIALDQGKLLSPESLERAMSRPAGEKGKRIPYGLGWFVLERDGIKYAWHYGLWVGDSALIIKVPQRKLTYVVLANSERLTSSYFHGRGELLTSPFARAFIQPFVMGAAELPKHEIDLR